MVRAPSPPLLPIALRREPRITQPPLRLDPIFTGRYHLERRSASRGLAFAAVPNLRIPVPLSLKEAQRSEHASEWMEACSKELESIHEMGTWELVDPPPGANILGSKWVFAVKTKPDGTLERFKARLVVQGFGQIEDLDYEKTFASTTGRGTVRTFFALVCALGMHCRQLDVTTAFLYGDVDKEIYMRQPPGHDDGSGKVCKLLRSLYGLKQAPRIWQETLRSSLLALGFVVSQLDPSLYFLKKGDKTLFLLDFVDDMVLASFHEHLIDSVVSDLLAEYKITDLGVPQKYVGMNVVRDIPKGELWLHQGPYILGMAEKFGVTVSSHPSTPLPWNFVLQRT